MKNNYDSQLQRLTLPDIFLVQLFSFDMRAGQRSGAVWVNQRLGAVWVGQCLGDRTRRADDSDEVMLLVFPLSPCTEACDDYLRASAV